jgi:hypothetical protein
MARPSSNGVLGGDCVSLEKLTNFVATCGDWFVGIDHCWMEASQ